MKLFHIGFALMLALGANPSAADITVYKAKTCGCCGKWVEHLRANGFRVTVNEVPTMTESQQRFGVPTTLRSCHTAIVEGHAPAADIQRLIKEKSKAKGIAVPGMSVGSPGMESDRRDADSFQKCNKQNVTQP